MILRLQPLAFVALFYFILVPSTTFALAPADVPADTPVSQLLTLASSALATGSSKDALAYYDLAITRDPKNYLTFFKRGATYLSLGRPKQALADFNNVLIIKPGFEGALVQRAKIHSRVAEWTEAKEDYLAAGKNNESEMVKELAEAEAAALQARDAAKHKNWDVCVTQSSVSIMTATGSLSLRQLRTRCRLEKGDIEEALADMQHVLQINPSATQPAMQISAMTFYSLGMSDKGLEAVRKCLQSDPDSKTCTTLFKREKKIDKLAKQARALLDKRSFASAVKLLVPQNEDDTGLLERVKDDMRAYRDQGIIHVKAPSTLLAQLLEMACEAYIEMNNHKRAQSYCTDLLSHSPHALPGLLHKAQAHLDSDDFEAAINVLNSAREHSPGGAQSRRVAELLQKAQTLLKRSRTKDYYKMLDVSRDASTAEIRKAYRRLSKTHHPDKVTSPEARPAAEKKMAAINEAYEVLSDPDLKARFDNGDDPNDPEAQQRAHNPFGGGGGGQPQFVFRQQGMPNFGGQQHFKFNGFPF